MKIKWILFLLLQCILINTQSCVPNFGNATAYSIIVGSGNYNAGTQQTHIGGGVAASGAITCNSPCTIGGPISSGNQAFTDALNSAIQVKSYLDGLSCTQTIVTSNVPANTVYNTGSGSGAVICAVSVSINFQGNIIINGQGNPDSIFIFRTDSSHTITFASNLVTIILTNGTQPCNVFFDSGSSITLGNNNQLNGTMIASGTVNFGGGTNLVGRAFSTTNGITPQTNIITNCSSSTQICGSGVCCMSDDTCQITLPNNCNGIFNQNITTCSFGQCFKNTIFPIFNCNTNFGNGTCQSFWGYNNTGNATTVNIGPNNAFSPGIQNEGQPFTFQKGVFNNVFSFFKNCSTVYTWNIDNNNATGTSAGTCLGSCCNPDDSCNIVSQDNCTSNNGTYTFNGTCSFGQCFQNVVTPLFDCNYDWRNGTCQVWFGYKNTGNRTITINIGPNNQFSGPFINRGQPSVFQPGEFHMVFSYDKNCSDIFIWTLDNQTATGVSSSTCLGSCCSKTGFCLDYTFGACNSTGGSFAGPSTSCSTTFCLQPNITIECPPTPFGNASNFALFGNGTVTANNAAIINNGNVGSNTGISGTFFFNNGVSQVNTPSTINTETEMVNGYNSINNKPCDFIIYGNINLPITFTPAVYCLIGLNNTITISGQMNFNGLNNLLPFFYIKSDSPLIISSPQSTLTNGALCGNIFFTANGNITLTTSDRTGIFITKSTILINSNVLNGRLYSDNIVTLSNSIVINNCNTSSCDLGTW